MIGEPTIAESFAARPGFSSSSLARFSARFSLIDFEVFLVMPCRGDLSLMLAPSSGA